jgi:hypothetical protein
LVRFLFHVVSLKLQSNAEDEYLEEINPLSNAFIYQLINGANYFDIEPILDSLISIITFRFFNESCSFILKEFDLEICKIPYELIRKILFRYINYHFFKNIDGSNFLAKPSFFMFDYEFDYIYKSGLDFVDFKFFSYLKNDYFNACYLSNDLFIDYNFLEMNIYCKDDLRKIIESLISKNDLAVVYIAGGIFSNYTEKSPLSQKFSNLYKNFKSKQDIDLYLIDNNNVLFEKYKNKFFAKKKRVFEIHSSLLLNPSSFNSSLINNNCTSFKIFAKGKIINFIFLQIWSNFEEYIKNFDFSVTRIYYSYRLDSIYLPVELLNRYSLFKRPRCDLFENINSLRFHYNYKLVLKYLEMDYEKFIEILRTENFEDFHFLATFLKVDFKRVLKYSFKYFFFSENDASLSFQKIELILYVFNDHLKNFYDLSYFDVILAFIKKHKERLESEFEEFK